MQEKRKKLIEDILNKEKYIPYGEEGDYYKFFDRKDDSDAVGVDDVYHSYAIFSFIKGDDKHKKQYEKDVIDAADWFEHPHPMGRDHRGESDFEAIRLVPLLFECPDSLSDELKFSLRRFFLQRNFKSIYNSENHALMYRVARYLAAQYYKGETFEQYGMTAEEILEKDEKFFRTFFDFRAGRGWGEFDSHGYIGEEVLMVTLLYQYAQNETVKKRAQMTLDIILLDMICDSRNGIYGGAHGRIYPPHALTGEGTMTDLYDYYFNTTFGCKNGVQANILLSDYVPSDIVHEIERKRKFPYMNREVKHLHSPSAWIEEDIKYENIKLLDNCFISKSTYVDEDYILGAVNHQDQYPEESEDKWYAHHQQHEWDLSLSGARNHKIFSHHPAKPDYHQMNNRWTGDVLCGCSTHYSDEKTAISIYNIEKEDVIEGINAHIPFDAFSQKVLEEKYIFLKYTDKLFIAIYVDNGYKINQEDEFKNREITSDGRQNCFVLRVEKAKDFADMDSFIEYIKSMPIKYDRTSQTVEFDDIKVWYHGNSKNGVTNEYPYAYVYDSPYMKSVWDSRVIECTAGDKKVVYDFNNDTITVQ